MIRQFARALLFAMAISAALANPAAAKEPNIVSKWNSVLLGQIVLNSSAPYANARQIAIFNLALHNAIQAIEQKYETYGSGVAPAPDASLEAAVSAAAYTTLTGLFPNTNETYVSSTYYNELARLPDNAAKARGIALGQEVAKQLLASRQDDNSADTAKNFGDVKPFALTAATQFAVPAPPAPGSAQFGTDLNRSKSLGERDSKTRTREQTEIGLFWSNTTVGTYGSAGHSLRIAQSIADQKGLANGEEARLLALTGLALADSAVASVYWKNVYKTKRPADLIRAGDAQANLAAQADWQPLSPTGGLDYPSTLTTYFGATSSVLQSFFRTDKVKFSVDSASLPGVTRNYSNITAVADEASNSRIYSGYHTPYSVRGGREILGPPIGKYVAENFLKPTRRVVAARQ